MTVRELKISSVMAAAFILGMPSAMSNNTVEHGSKCMSRGLAKRHIKRVHDD